MSGALQAAFQNQRSFGTPPGQDAYTTAGTYTWVAPTGVTSVSVLAVGAGSSGTTGCCYNSNYGGGGGALGYLNNYPVTPGNSYTVVVGSGSTGALGPNNSYFVNTSTVKGGGGGGPTAGCMTLGGTRCNIASGGNKGGNGTTGGGTGRGSGGGAGGFSGTPESGGRAISGGCTAIAGVGGGGGGGNRRGGGGVGLLGQGPNGAGAVAGNRGCGGSGGEGGGASSTSAKYGGGGGSGNAGGVGAVRIIWPGTTRQYPSTCTGDV